MSYTDTVFPTHVGVFPTAPHRCSRGYCLPHACGGVSHAVDAIRYALESSPRMWGCFQVSKVKEKEMKVFPTHVGVFHHVDEAPTLGVSLPHACGGVATISVMRTPTPWPSPRAGRS